LHTPLADRIRPSTIDEVVGQKHLLGKGKLLRNIIENAEIPNMIFFGPSGTGKTTIANIISKKSGKPLYRLNATNASVSDIKQIVGDLDGFMAQNGVLLYLDEIQHFNKKQQQTLLEYIENGRITLIASTTENPYFYVYNTVLSRSEDLEFREIPAEEVEKAIRRGIGILCREDYAAYQVEVQEDAILHFAHTSGGDVRKALNALEVAFLAAVPDKNGTLLISKELSEQATQKKAMRYDRDGDSHYDLLSAFQKSIRGSDPDAAIYYLARLVAAGDLPSICRRILVMAAEDIGLAYPQAISIVKACVDSAMQLGFPEARIPLSEAVLLLATAPKSNSAVMAIDAALHDLETTDTGEIPAHLKDSHYGGAQKLGHGVDYLYPHSFPNHYVKQQYLPDAIRDRVYYEYGSNKQERSAQEYWEKIKNEKK